MSINELVAAGKVACRGGLQLNKALKFMKISKVMLISIVMASTAVCRGSLSKVIPINPGNVGNQRFLFEITDSKKGDLDHFVVKVSEKAEKFQSFLIGALTVDDGHKIARCKVEGEKSRGAVTYEFDLAPQYRKASKFSFVSIPEVGDIPLSGGRSYSITLGDF